MLWKSCIGTLTLVAGRQGNNGAVDAETDVDGMRSRSIASRNRAFSSSTWRIDMPTVEMGSPTLSVISPG